MAAYARTNDSKYTGPAIPVAILGGLALASVLYETIRPIVGILAEWIAYFGIVTLPVAAVLGLVVSRRFSPRRGAYAAATVTVSTLGVAGGAIATGIDPSFWVVLFSAFVVPVAYVIGDTIVTRPEGRIGVLGPFVIVGGILLGALLERQLGIQGQRGTSRQHSF
ncbi:hypothetical protein ACFQL4_02520 [Halosimplex aquaticum]